MLLQPVEDFARHRREVAQILDRARGRDIEAEADVERVAFGVILRVILAEDPRAAHRRCQQHRTPRLFDGEPADVEAAEKVGGRQMPGEQIAELDLRDVRA